MKPAPFDYAAPRTVDEAFSLLGEDAKALAGGQSLVPLLNFRLARPKLIVDLNGIAELGTIRRGGGALRIGALVRQRALERSRLVAEGWPVLRDAVSHVAHPAIRNRGTVGGSAAHADPAAELPCALAALGARFHVRSRRGARTRNRGRARSVRASGFSSTRRIARSSGSHISTAARSTASGGAGQSWVRRTSSSMADTRSPTASPSMSCFGNTQRSFSTSCPR